MGQSSSLATGLNNQMNTHRFTRLMIAAFGLAAFSSAGCTEKGPAADASLPPAKDAASTTVTTTVPGPADTIQAKIVASPNIAIPQWTDINVCTYDERARFFAGLDKLEARLDREIARLTAKRSGMKSTANTQEWDFAMKEMEDARSNLKSMGEELRKASPEIWGQEKDKVGQAWSRTQDAYDKVKSSTTS
jgi:hypothetical protein